VRGLFQRLIIWRRERPWDVPTSELYLLMRAAESLTATATKDLLSDYLRAIDLEPNRPRDNCRVLVVGAFCEQPPLGLIRTIERAGCYIVEDDFLLGNRMLRGRVPLRGDPVEALARAFVETSVPSSVIYEGDPTAKRRLMKERADAARADGIIFAAPSFCDPALLDRPMLRAGAEAHGIPCIAFKYAENTGQFQQFREQAGTFSDSIKLWGAAK
jgi:benzoyl-CoA reductase subunit C